MPLSINATQHKCHSAKNDLHWVLLCWVSFFYVSHFNNGATALSRMTLSIITFSTDTQHKGNKKFYFRQLANLTLSMKTICIKCHNAECHYADRHIWFIVILKSISLSVILLNVIMLSVVASFSLLFFILFSGLQMGSEAVFLVVCDPHMNELWAN